MKYFLDVLVLLCCVVFTVHISEAVDDSQDIAFSKRLFDDLMAGYNKHIRPAGHSTPVTVRLELSITSIHKLDSGLLEFQAWISKHWNDTSLLWNPDDYGGVRDIRLPHDMIWKPDITLYNSLDHLSYKSYDVLAVVSFTGEISLVLPVTIKATCPTNRNEDGTTSDEQSCSLKFGSWVYDGFQIDLESHEGMGVDLSSYTPNEDWHVVNTSASKNVIYYPCCVEPYPEITYTISLSRVRQKSRVVQGHQSQTMNQTDEPEAKKLNFGMVFLVILIPTMFLLPPDSKEKITLGCGLLITMAILVSNGSPHSWTLVGFETNMILVSISILMSTLVLNAWHNSTGSRLTPCLRKMTYYLARLTCVHCSSQTPSDDAVEMASDGTREPINSVRGENEAPSNECHLLVKVVDRLLCVVFFVVTLTTEMVLAV